MNIKVLLTALVLAFTSNVMAEGDQAVMSKQEKKKLQKSLVKQCREQFKDKGLAKVQQRKATWKCVRQEMKKIQEERQAASNN